MWGMITQLKLATASLGSIYTLSPLEVGLVGLIWLAVGLLVWMAARDIYPIELRINKEIRS